MYAVPEPGAERTDRRPLDTGSGCLPPASELCEFLPWDSTFFGCRIARATCTRLNNALAQNALQWGVSNRIDCLYLLADADDDETVRTAEQNGFHLVDVRVTLEYRFRANRRLEECTSAPLVRRFAAADVPALRQIAARSYGSTRFHYDRNFARDRADQLYEIWIEKSCTGYADEVFVAELHGQAAGFVSCHLDGAGLGRIGLVGVRGEACGLGIGYALVNTSLNWLSDRCTERVRIVTQGRNVPAQRLYQRCGFLTHAVHLWYHRWFPL